MLPGSGRGAYLRCMKIAGAMLADRAEVVGGLLNVVGGGWRYFGRPSFPTTVQGWIVGVLELEPDALGSAPVLRLNIENSDGQDQGLAGSIVVDAMETDAMPMRGVFAVPFSVAVPVPGTMTFSLSGDGFGVLGEIVLPVTQI